MKKILGLDLGTNSIGWALVDSDFKEKKGEIISSGSRIMPMSKAVLSDFEKGITKSQTKDRTDNRGVRRLYERSNIRRERLHRVLNVLDYLPKTYSKYIDFNSKKGKFKKNYVPLLPYSNQGNEEGKRIFLFMESYLEMEKEFREIHLDLPKTNKKGKPFRLPYDWTLYYLRKKGLKEEISNEELAWVLLNFNQKRGYYQEREEKEVKIDESKTVEYIVLKAKEFVETEDRVDGKLLYKIIFDNGWEYDKPTTKPQIWENISREFIVTSTLNKDKTIKRSFKKVDSEKDWEAIKRKTEQDLGNKFVGKYIYESILKNPKQKIKGKLIQTIDRDFYFDELEVILRTQFRYRESEWSNETLYEKAIIELYPNNKEHRENLLKQRDKFIYLFLRDILFYHRPLKSQKSLISKCVFEKRTYKDKETGEKKTIRINGIPKSHPLYQEFRILQLAHNIRLQKRETLIDDKLILNQDVTDKFIKNNEDFILFFEFLYNKKELTQKQLVTHFIKDKNQQKSYRWNFTDDVKIKLDCNQTRPILLSKFSKADKSKFSTNLELKLWHIIYSVTDKKEYLQTIERFVLKNGLSEETKESLARTPMLKKEYASYSEKAIKKLLSLMRRGKYWKEGRIDAKTLERINKLLTGEFDETIKTRVREKAINLTEINEFQGLPLWLASYIIYGKHSEVDATQWTTSKELRDYIKAFKQHSLRNPIVEQVLLESLRVTLDIWENYGEKFNINFETYIDEETGKERKAYQRLFNEIHIEIGRDLKNPKKARERMFKSINKNKDTNQRIRKLLYELANYNDVKEVKPKSRTHFDKLKIYEQTVLSNYTDKELDKEKLEGSFTVSKFIKKDQPTSKEILKYKLWLEQKYKSPYTGSVIQLSELFTPKYEIEHIIPQAKFLDNSFNNKIICEAEVNRLKDNRTAYNFIQEYQDTEVPLSVGEKIVVLSQKVYEEFVKDNYEGKKLDNLLREDIPQKMSERQKNDMRYISKEALKIFSNIVREEGEQESTSKNVLPVAGGVTAKLRGEWGINAVWSDLVKDRFTRLNRLVCGEESEADGLFGKVLENGNFKPEVPIEMRNDFELKRIDHRHHALDAIVIAVTTRSHVNYINNNHAKEGKKRFDLGRTLRTTKEIEKTNILTGEKTKHTVLDNYIKPWGDFTSETKQSLEQVVVSFKQNLRAINKATNYNWRYKNEKGEFLFDKSGNKKKQLVEQQSYLTNNQSNIKPNWAIRKSLHEETVYGILKGGAFKGKLVKREELNTSFTETKIKDAIIDKVVQNILLKHLRQEKFLNQVNENDERLEPHEVAFSPKGIEDLNANIIALNNGKFHHPIKRVRLHFTKGKQFAIKKWEDKEGNLQEDKFVKSASGTNLYFCIYEKEGERKYYVPTFEEILATQKLEQNLPLYEKRNVPERHPDFIDFDLKFYLQPNDLVYLPKEYEEEVDFANLTSNQLKRIYLFKDGSGTTANFIPMYSSDVIYNISDNNKRKVFVKEYNLDFNTLIKNEYGLGSPQLKNQNSLEGIQIKSKCWKLKTDRLGKIVNVMK